MYVNHKFTIAVITVIFALCRDFRQLPCLCVMPGFEHHVSMPFSRYRSRTAVAVAVPLCRDAILYRDRIQAIQQLLLGPVVRQAQEGGAPGA